MSSLNHHFQAHLQLLTSTACSQFRYIVCRWVVISIHRYIDIYIHRREYNLNTRVWTIIEWYVVAMISRRTCRFPKKMIFPACSTVIRGDPRLVVGAFRLVVSGLRLVASIPRLLASASRHFTGAPRLVAGAPRCFQVHPKFSPALRGVPKLITITPKVLLYQSIRDRSYSEDRPEFPPTVWYSPEFDAFKFTLHILSDTSGGSHRLKYILLMLHDISHY
jgi:hypothetical protein